MSLPIYVIFWCAEAHISAKLGGIRDIDVYMESGENAGPVWAQFDQSRHTSMCAWYVLGCTDPYLSQIWSYQRDQGIYSMRWICQTCLSTQFDLSAQASVHACCLLESTGPYLKSNWVWSERSKYLWYRENMQDLLGPKIGPKHTSLCACTLCACVHKHISWPNCLDQRDQGIHGIRRTCWTCLST